MATPNLLLVPSGYKATKLYSVIPSDGSGDFNHSMTTVAARINSAKLIENMAIDVPRIDYQNTTCPVLLLEDAATNLITYPVSFDNTSGWTLSGTTLTSGQASPHADYPTSAYKLVESAVEEEHRLLHESVFGILAGETFNFSARLKKGERDWAILQTFFTLFGTTRVWFDLANGVVGSSFADVNLTITNINMVALGNGYFECSYSITNSSSDTQIRPYIIVADANNSTSYQGNGTSGIYIFGAQFEKSDHASSFIYDGVEGSAVTRAADVCAGATYPNSSSSGVFFVELKFNEYSSDLGLISTSDGTASNRVYISNFTSSRIRGIFEGDGAVIALYYTVPDEAALYKVALRWNETSQELWVNGELRDSTNEASIITGMNQVDFAYPDGTTYNFYGKAKQLQMLEYLTDAEMITLTS